MCSPFSYMERWWRSGVSRAGAEEEASVACVCRSARLGDEPTTQVGLDDLADNLAPVERGPAGLGEHVGVAQGPSRGGVDEDHVGVRLDGQAPLAGPHAVGLG